MGLATSLSARTIALGAVCVTPWVSSGFTMLGPFADWMTKDLGYNVQHGMGGPMNIGENYRWNIPVVTYGFDQSFLTYFGSNGVREVESAIELLNDLPPASLIDPAQYATDAWRQNYLATALELIDLQSFSLAMLLEQLGLGPEEYIWNLRYRYLPPGADCPGYVYGVIQRNFDPLTLQPSPYVNENLFTYQVLESCPMSDQAYCLEQLLDPNGEFNSAVASFPPGWGAGFFATNLTRDDVGGIRYLLSGSQVRLESLPSDVQGAGPNASTYVATAYRPGIEKITFVRHPYGALSGAFMPCTNEWVDLFYDGDLAAYQQVRRVTTRPDIIFSAADLTSTTNAGPAFVRTGSENWVNHSALNGNPGGAGPGVIVPPITITFNKVGPFWLNYGPGFITEASSVLRYVKWGSFGGTTNYPIIYPSVSTNVASTTVSLHLKSASSTNSFHWLISDRPYGLSELQTGTSLREWTSLATVTNTGLHVEWQYPIIMDEPQRFFRLIRQGY